jgi:hypothetical protein
VPAACPSRQQGRGSQGQRQSRRCADGRRKRKVAELLILSVPQSLKRVAQWSGPGEYSREVQQPTKPNGTGSACDTTLGVVWSCIRPRRSNLTQLRSMALNVLQRLSIDRGRVAYGEPGGKEPGVGLTVPWEQDWEQTLA